MTVCQAQGACMYRTSFFNDLVRTLEYEVLFDLAALWYRETAMISRFIEIEIQMAPRKHQNAKQMDYRNDQVFTRE